MKPIIIILIALTAIACQPQAPQGLLKASSEPTDKKSEPTPEEDLNQKQGTITAYSENVDEISYKINYNCSYTYCEFRGSIYRYAGMKKINNVFKYTFYKAKIHFSAHNGSGLRENNFIGQSFQPNDYLGMAHSGAMPMMFDFDTNQLYAHYGTAITSNRFVTEEEFNENIQNFDGHIVDFIGTYSNGEAWENILDN